MIDPVEKTEDESLGRTTYEAYLKSCKGVSIHGEVLPRWYDLRADIQTHWENAGIAVLKSIQSVKLHHGLSYDGTVDRLAADLPECIQKWRMVRAMVCHYDTWV